MTVTATMNSGGDVHRGRLCDAEGGDRPESRKKGIDFHGFMEVFWFFETNREAAGLQVVLNLACGEGIEIV